MNKEYLYKLKDNHRYVELIELLEEEIKKKDGKQYYTLLAEAYDNNLLVKNRDDLYVKYNMKACKEGDGEAYYNMACYYDGSFKAKEEKNSRKYMQIACDKKCLKSYMKIASLYYRGAEGYNRSIDNALFYYDSVVKEKSENYTEALLRAAKLYTMDACSKKNVKKAEEYYSRAMENKDYRDTYYEVGNYYLNNNFQKAIEVYKLGIKEFNDARCMVALGDIYFKGNAEIEKNLELAFKYYMTGARLMNDQALIKVSECYKNGYGVEKDKVEAEKFYNIAKIVNPFIYVEKES